MQIKFILHWESFICRRNGGKGEFEWTSPPGLKKKKSWIKGCSAMHMKRGLLYAHTCSSILKSHWKKVREKL